VLSVCSSHSWGNNAPVIVVLGDSLSAGFGLQQGEGWVSLLQQKLQQQAYPHRVINASISGDTTGSALARLANALQHRPNILIVELGGNDGLRGLPLKTMQSNLRQIIEQGQQIGAKVLLLGMQIPPNYGPLFAQRFTQTYETVARDTGAVLLPFFLAGMEADTRFYQADQIHPNAKGQPLMLQNVWEKLQPML